MEGVKYDVRPQDVTVHPIIQNVDKVDITFKNLTYKVQVQNTKLDGPKFVERMVLNDISGICPGGEVTAILGASGAGKTSLLNILAKRVSNGGKVSLTGELCANSTPYDSQRFATFASYVMQNDILFETLTPREAFQFVADLKFRDTQQKTLRVNESIKQLKLERCQHTMIGGPLLKGISGGEKKRTSIGFELVSDPKVILLDEPTSGLDSFTAFSIINLMKKISQNLHKTIIFTIHQPSADIYDLFDRIMLLVEGKFIFQGPKQDLVPYFAEIGFKCPKFSNPMDYMLSIMHAESQINQKNYSTYYQGYDNRWRAIVNNEIEACSKQQINQKQVETTFAYQISKICGRALVNIKRDPMIVKGRMITGIFMGLLTGGIYYGVGTNIHGFRNLQSTSGTIFFMTVAGIMGALNPVMIQFPAERAVFLREENSKLYTTFAYFLGKSSMEIPFMFIVPIIQQLICYWMIGLNDTKVEIVIIHLLIFCLLSLCGNSFGLMGGCIFEDVKVAAGVIPMFVMPMMLFSGFYQNKGNLMAWISWLQYLSPMKYAFEALMYNNYDNLDATPDPLTLYNFDIGLWNSIYLLIAFIFIYRIIAFIFLVILKRKIQ